MATNNGNGKSALLGSDSLAEAMGNARPPLEEQVKIGDTDRIRRQPVSDEALEWMSLRRAGTHPLMNFWPAFMQVQVAQVLGRQLTLDEVKFFVGIDGDENSTLCSVSIGKKERRISSEIQSVKQQCDANLRRLDALSSEYDEDQLKSSRAELCERTEFEIQELEKQLENNSDCRFTPVWWVDPFMNSRLLDEIRGNGGDVKKAFLAGDMVGGIIRSGCFYENTDGELVGFSGTPWFSVGGQFRPYTNSPIGRAAFNHPRVRDFNKRTPGNKRWYWGISNFHRRIIAGLESASEASSTDAVPDEGVDNDLVDDLV